MPNKSNGDSTPPIKEREDKGEKEDAAQPGAKGSYILAHKNGIAGAVAGVVTAFLTCPLDVVRTRLQVQHMAKIHKYSGLRQALALILKEEGFLGFFRGLGPQLFGFVPSWAIYFTVYGHLNPILSSATDGKWNPSLVHLLSAVGAGAVTNLGTTPFFAIKTRLQTQQILMLKKSIDPKLVEGEKIVVYRGTWDALTKIVHNEGPKALWSGLVPSMIGLIHVAIQFPLYEKFKHMAQARKPTPETPLSLSELFLCAAGSKLVASAAAYPHEVIRSRLQAENNYKGVFDVVRTTIKEEGIRGLYSGLGVTLVRTVPAAMITLSAYEETKQIIEKMYAG